jgi:hypothetical protein
MGTDEYPVVSRRLKRMQAQSPQIAMTFNNVFLTGGTDESMQRLPACFHLTRE